MAIYRHSVARRAILLPLMFTLVAVALHAQPTALLTDQQKSEIDDIARKVMEKSGIPSASLAVVTGGKLTRRHTGRRDWNRHWWRQRRCRTASGQSASSLRRH